MEQRFSNRKIDMIFETHAHYEGEEFDSDRIELLSSLKDENIYKVIDVGSSIETSRQAVELARQYDYMYAAVGVHPDSVAEMTEQDIDELRKMSSDSKVVAIGEIGPDYYYDYTDEEKEKQLYWYKRQLDLALELNLPVIIHSRDAAKDTFDIMKEYSGRGLQGVMHCYGYSAEQAKQYVKMGYYLGIGGALTFKNAVKKVEVVREIPLEFIVLETDCPYMAPVPVRGTRNYSGNLKYVVEKIAEIKGISTEEVERITYDNAMKLFRIKEDN